MTIPCVYGVRLSKQVLALRQVYFYKKESNKKIQMWHAKESSTSKWRGDEDHIIKNRKKVRESVGMEDSLDMAIGHCWRHVCWS